MKSFLAAAITCLATTSVFANPGVKAEPTSEAVTFSKVYVPVGFDSNDNVQFVGEGTFANSCYRPAPVSTSIDQATKTIKVSPVAYKYNGLCLQVILPFQRTVDVGVLPAGTWQIVNSADGKQVGQIKVAPALTADPDDFTYAPISQAFLHQDGAKIQVMLNGTFPNDCFSMQEVKTNVSDDVIIIQPIAQVASGTCSGPAKSFNQVIDLPAMKAGRYLLHVRSMNAQAVNSIVDVQ